MSRTNKHKKQYIAKWKFDALTLILVTIIAALLIGAISNVFAKEPPVSPLGNPIHFVDKPVEFVSERPTDINKAVCTTEKCKITNYLEKVFGKDAQDAVRMLSECENKSLDTNAINYNRNGTVDRGLFQINSIHGGEEMFDYKTNIDKAHEIFTRNNNTFYAWTCGYIVGHRTYLDALRGN